MKRLLEGQQLQRTVPPTAGRVEPVVRLPGGLTLDDRSCWQYPTMLVGNVGSGKSTLMEQIRRPVLAHADRVQDTVVIFAAKPDVLRCRRPGAPVISVSATDPANCWNIFRELDVSDTPDLTLREIASALFAEQKKKTTQIFFPEAAQEIFYQTARFMQDFGRTNNIPVSNAELSEFLTRTTVFLPPGFLSGTGEPRGWVYSARYAPCSAACSLAASTQPTAGSRPCRQSGRAASRAASGCLSSMSRTKQERLCRFSGCCWI